ncbi:MAG: hypothetical protein PHC51_05435 [bacterium]|nr:hypothetical protein [bacterium]
MNTELLVVIPAILLSFALLCVGFLRLGNMVHRFDPTDDRPIDELSGVRRAMQKNVTAISAAFFTTMLPLVIIKLNSLLSGLDSQAISQSYYHLFYAGCGASLSFEGLIFFTRVWRSIELISIQAKLRQGRLVIDNEFQDDFLCASQHVAYQTVLFSALHLVAVVVIGSAFWEHPPQQPLTTVEMIGAFLIGTCSAALCLHAVDKIFPLKPWMEKALIS